MICLFLGGGFLFLWKPEGRSHKDRKLTHILAEETELTTPTLPPMGSLQTGSLHTHIVNMFTMFTTPRSPPFHLLRPYPDYFSPTHTFRSPPLPPSADMQELKIGFCLTSFFFKNLLHTPILPPHRHYTKISRSSSL